jgi:peptidoglycan-N-acetylglucosamine deacetylase
MLTPSQRRFISYLIAGILGIEALIQLLRGEFGLAHLLLFSATGILLIPTLWRNCSWFGPVKTHFFTTEREVWLTLDDGPDPQQTPQILEVLARHGAHATFFAIGERILEHPLLAQRIIREGHQLQNHSFHHPAASFWIASPKRVRDEIAKGSDAIEATVGERPRLFRVPVGLANPFVHAEVARTGLRLIGWSATGWDGIPHTPAKVIDLILRSLTPGGIILLHEGGLHGMPQGSRAETLDQLLCRLKELGYRTTLPSLRKH